MSENNENEEMVRVLELYEELQELTSGEKILDVLYALEKLIVQMVTCNCVSKSAAVEVIDTMHKNMGEMINTLEDMKLTIWQSKDHLN
jgi:hypothetical protein